MIKAGIESINIYCGSASIDVLELAKHRNLDVTRFSNLLMDQKTVPMPFEDPISNAINAAKPIIDKLTEKEKNDIDLLITCTESGIDFGKSMSTYIHHYLELNRNCRLFEIKHACYSGTAGFQMAVNFILSQTAPDKKALVIATDIARMGPAQGSFDSRFAEPSSGSGAVAMLISDKPEVFQIDKGASGYYGYEVMDACRPVPDAEVGDSDLSLLSYLDCCENSYREYEKRVDGADYVSTFQYLVFHTPFGGMVKGAHRTNMRKFKKANQQMIEEDFNLRVAPSIEYCKKVGNIMGASAHLSLVSAIENGSFENPKRLGIFSYGSGCCSEFYSGIVTKSGQEKLRQFNIAKHLEDRVLLDMEAYEQTFETNEKLKFGTKNFEVDLNKYVNIFKSIKGNNKLVFTGMKDYHRAYKWV